LKFCFTMSEDLHGMAVFVAVADAKGFTAAAQQLGVSASAVSQSVRKLEAQLGVTLLQRSTRSVRLTEAGERLYATVAPALADVRSTVAELGAMSSEPRGTLRLHVSTGAVEFLRGPLVAEFLAAHPHVRLAVEVNDERIDVVAGGYDAGIEIGEVIDKDMIVVPVSGELELAIVGAPSYFARHPAPKHPRDLTEHTCINWHRSADDPPYRWEFTEKGRDFSVAVDMVREWLERGALVRVLAAYCPPFPGCFLYYPERRQASPPLRALVEHLLLRRQEGRGRASRR